MDANGFNEYEPAQDLEHGFNNFDHGAADVVLAVAFNSSGSRLALGSADHKIRVYDIEQDETSTLVDQWRGHDAEVLDASLPDLHYAWVLRLFLQGQMGWIHSGSNIRYHWR